MQCDRTEYRLEATAVVSFFLYTPPKPYINRMPAQTDWLVSSIKIDLDLHTGPKFHYYLRTSVCVILF